MFSKITALALLVPTVVFAQEITTALDCKQSYDKAREEILSMEAQCEALVQFSKCLSAFPKSDLMETELFTRNSKACEPHWKSIGNPELRTKRGNFELTVDDAKNVNFYRHRREQINVFTMNDQIIELQRLVASLKSELAKNLTTVVNSVDTKIDDVGKNVDGKIDDLIQTQADNEQALKNKVQESLNGVQSTLDSTKASLNSKVKNVEDSVDATVTKLTSDTEKAIAASASDVQKKLDTAVTGMNKKVTDIEKATVDTPLHMWSGGSRSSMRHNGWRDFNLDRIEIDTAAPYFQRQSNTRFKALKSGMYKVTFHIRQYTGNWAWRHMQFIVNGKGVNNANYRHIHSWDTQTYEVVWPIKAGQQFWGKAYVSGSNPYNYAGAGSWEGADMRVQVEYKGQLAGKCTSQFNLCV